MEGAEIDTMLEGDAAGRLRRELQEQEFMLRGVITRLGQARDQLISPGQGLDWSGPARLVYNAGLGRLRAELTNAEGHLDDALRETRRALTTVGSRGK